MNKSLDFDIPLFDYLEVAERIKLKNLDEKLNYDITEGFREKIRQSVEQPMSFDLQYYARKGKGKSMCALKSIQTRDELKAERDDKTYEPESFDFERIHFTTESLEKYFRENHKTIKDTAVLIDEQIGNWGHGSYINMQKIAVFTETLRKKQVNFNYASPSGRYMSMFQYDFLIQPIAITKKSDKFGTILLSGVFTKDNNMIGAIYTKLPHKFISNGYDKMKDNALDMFIQLSLNEEDKFEEVVDNLIKKYNMFNWIDALKDWADANKEDRFSMKKPAKLTKSSIRALLSREPYKYSITEEERISDLVFLKLEGVLPYEEEKSKTNKTKQSSKKSKKSRKVSIKN